MMLNAYLVVVIADKDIQTDICISWADFATEYIRILPRPTAGTIYWAADMPVAMKGATPAPMMELGSTPLQLLLQAAYKF